MECSRAWCGLEGEVVGNLAMRVRLSNDVSRGKIVVVL